MGAHRPPVVVGAAEALGGGTVSGINVRITEVTVCLLPEDSINHHAYAVTVQWRGDETYAVCHFRDCLSKDGTWDYESIPSERTDEWKAAHRFGYWEAMELAMKAAPDIVVNGRSAQQVLALAAVKSDVLGTQDATTKESTP